MGRQSSPPRIEVPCARPGCDCVTVISARWKTQPKFCGRECAAAVQAEQQRGRIMPPSFTVLTEDEVRLIRASDEPASKLADRYGVGAVAIQRVRKRQAWRHVP